MVYNCTMHDEPDDKFPTVADALKHVIRNAENINMERLADDLQRTQWVVRDGNQSATSFVSKFIKTYPAFALEKVQRNVFATVNAPEAVKHMIAGDKVAAIKIIRYAYSLGLKESKDVADRLQDELFIRGLVNSPFSVRELTEKPFDISARFDHGQQTAFNHIMEHVNG